MVNQNLQPTAPATMELEELNLKSQQAISVLGSGNTPYQVDVTPVLLQNPDSPFAIALSVAIVLGAIAGLIKTLKSM
ncbi:MAG: hypothetical protein EA343_05350 [Nodularia sp. (in: Bacteria)]|nr:MAG: hypothetical protein EA343_05350 [Nodularia sp. (in: cyanobacteria)]